MDAEIYTGAYQDKLKNSSWFKLEDFEVKIVKPYISTSDYIDNRVTLTLNDKKNRFWPVILRLEKQEVDNLVKVLTDANLYDFDKQGHQFIVSVTSEKIEEIQK